MLAQQQQIRAPCLHRAITHAAPQHAAPSPATQLQRPAVLRQAKRLRVQRLTCQAAVAQAPREEKFDPQVGGAQQGGWLRQHPPQCKPPSIKH